MSGLGDTFITIVGIVLAAILMFGFPLMSMSDRTDDIVTMTAQTATTEFVDDVRVTGLLTSDKLAAFDQKLAATGNAYDREMEVKVLDENPGKKTTQANYTKIGENVYYTQYTTQVLESLEQGSMLLEPGDNILVSVKNQNSTAAQSLNASFLGITNSDTYAISAEGAGMIYVKGTE